MSRVALSRAGKEIGALELTLPERANWRGNMEVANLQLPFASPSLLKWYHYYERELDGQRGWNTCHVNRAVRWTTVGPT